MQAHGYPDSHPWWPWLVAQKEAHLLFMSWAVDPNLIRGRIPRKFHLDTFDGQAWVTLAPFHMQDLHMRFLPPIPGTCDFPELDFFTYVTVNGQPGQYFFSIFAKGSLFSMTANLIGLPYRKAGIDFIRNGTECSFRAVTHKSPGDTLIDLSYSPQGEPYYAREGTLEFFLAERYTMYSRVLNMLTFRGDEARAPRELYSADLTLNSNLVFDHFGLTLSSQPDNLFYTPVADDKTWAPYPIIVK